MQYKGLLLAIIIASPLSTIYAQKAPVQPIILGGNSSRVIKKDSIVVNKSPIVNRSSCIATPSILLTTATSASDCCKPVPLAGQKSYFGSMNEYVETYTRQYMSVHNKTLSVVQGRSNQHFSLMENVLQQNNVPKELKYLAVIESALNNKALSGAGAVGPWQLMESTARMMGLTVNTKRDDRTDWFKSTNAAAKYLTFLYSQLNDWLLVVAAYNSGPTPVQRAISRTGSNNFWDIKKYLPRETQGHVLAFIATASIFENMSKFIGAGKIPLDFKFSKEDALAAETKPAPKPMFTDEELKSMAIVRISEPVNLEYLSQDLKVDRKLLEKWNPDYDLFVFDTYNTDYYSLRIPKEKLDNFIDRKELITKRSKQMFAEMNL